MNVRTLPDLFAWLQATLNGANPSNESESEASPVFNLSNPAIQANLNAAGAILSARTTKGVPATTVPWKLDVIPVNTGPVLAKSKVQTKLLQEQMPLTSYTCGGLTCQIISFAPRSAQEERVLPGVIQILHISNPSPVTQSVLLRFPAEFSAWEPGGLRIDFPGAAGLLPLDDPHPEIGSLDFDLEPGDERYLSFAWILGGTSNEVRATGKLLQQQSAPAWLEEALAPSA